MVPNCLTSAGASATSAVRNWDWLHACSLKLTARSGISGLRDRRRGGHLGQHVALVLHLLQAVPGGRDPLARIVLDAPLTVAPAVQPADRGVSVRIRRLVD